MKFFRKVAVAVGLMTSLGLSSQAFSFGRTLANAVYGVMEASSRLVDHGLYATANLADTSLGLAGNMFGAGLGMAADMVDTGAYLGWQSMSLAYNTAVWSANTAMDLSQQSALVAAGGLYYAARDLSYIMSTGIDVSNYAYTSAVDNFRNAYHTYQQYSYVGWDGYDDLSLHAQKFSW